MTPYWMMYFLWMLMGLAGARGRVSPRYVLFFAVASVLTTLFIGFRYEVGGDWGNYLRIYDNIYFLDLVDGLRETDPAYALLNWLSAQADIGIVLVNFACAIIMMGGFARLAWQQPNPGLAVLVAVPYLIIVVAMGYTRQAAAIGIVCFAIAEASEKRILRLVILIGIAALFHKTAILLLPIALLPVLRRNLLLGVFGGVVFAVLFALLLRDRSDDLIQNYVNSNMNSQGAAIRVSMNVVAGSLFLLLRRHMDIPPFQKEFWTACAVLSLVSVAALAVASASSGVDRFSLYIIPLQSIVYARIPYALGRGKPLPSATIGIVAYSFLVQFVWLNYADNAGYWLPYSLGVSA